jgi:hypothetical protein
MHDPSQLVQLFIQNKSNRDKIENIRFETSIKIKQLKPAPFVELDQSEARLQQEIHMKEGAFNFTIHPCLISPLIGLFVFT